jgi:hypothetical protein
MEGVTGQQRMLTAPWRLFLPSHLSGVRVVSQSILCLPFWLWLGLIHYIVNCAISYSWQLEQTQLLLSVNLTFWHVFFCEYHFHWNINNCEFCKHMSYGYLGQNWYLHPLFSQKASKWWPFSETAKTEFCVTTGLVTTNWKKVFSLHFDFVLLQMYLRWMFETWLLIEYSSTHIHWKLNLYKCQLDSKCRY